MGNSVLLISFTILVFMAVCGYRKGFIRMAFSLVSIIIVLMIVNTLTPVVSQTISDTDIYEWANDKMDKYISNYIEDAAENTASVGVSAQTDLIKTLPLPTSVQETLIENNTDRIYQEMGVDNFLSYLSQAMTKMLINAIIYIILFVIIIIVVRVAINLLDIIAKLPVLNLLNKTMGTVFGLLEGLVILWIGCIILTAFSQTGWSWVEAALTEINDSAFLTLIYNSNMFGKVVTGIF